MSDLKVVPESKARTLAEVQSDYQNLCLKAGHTQYQITVLQNELDMMNSSLRDLNLEAASIKAPEAAPEVKPEESKEPQNG